MNFAPIEAGPPPCRLCDGATSPSFAGKILGKYAVGYWLCRQCGSLQTDQPHWLHEAYENLAPARDVGMVARTLQMAQLTSAILRIAGVGAETAGLDFGGGNGLFCRMMRDQGFNFFNDDKYAEPYYCVGFTRESRGLRQFDVLTSFEVFEHLPNPKAELGALLAFDPKLWILSTQLHANQGPDWRYLAPASGAHVFFYSEKALHDFADRHGLLFLPGRHLHMFLKRERNPFLPSGHAKRLLQKVLAGGRAVTLGATLHFAARQRRAYLRWQADRDAMP